MTVVIGCNCETGQLIFCCNHKCKIDDINQLATKLDGVKEFICKECMATIQEIMSEMMIDKINQRNKAKKVKRKIREKMAADSDINIKIVPVGD